MSDKKNWASEYILNPLTEPTPAEETGLNASFAVKPTGSPTSHANVAPQNTGSSTSTNPFRRNNPAPVSPPGASAPRASHSKRASADLAPHGKSPASADARAVSGASVRSTGSTSASARKEAFAGYKDVSPSGSPQQSPTGDSFGNSGRPRRSSSLRERYPGDPSVHPLDTLKREAKHAHRSPHLHKKHLPGSDSIDKLDDSVPGAYHHEGPYDAASLARNNSYNSAPLAALAGSTRQALQATPRENIQDSIQRHRPLDGVASVPPGEPDRFGRVYHYREGPEEDMMRNGLPEGGAYKRYPGVDYLPEDLKGKGEPSYSIEKSIKDHDRARAQAGGDDGDALELSERPRHSSRHGGSPKAGGSRDGVDALADGIAGTGLGGSGTGASSSHGHGHGHDRHRSGSGGLEGLKRRIGSLRRKDK